MFDRFEPALDACQEQTGSLVGRSLAMLAGEVDFAQWHVFFTGERLDSEALRASNALRFGALGVLPAGERALDRWLQGSGEAGTSDTADRLGRGCGGAVHRRELSETASSLAPIPMGSTEAEICMQPEAQRV